MSAPEDAGDAPEGWMPSTTAGRVFFQLPTSPKGFGRVVGVDGVSSIVLLVYDSATPPGR